MWKNQLLIEYELYFNLSLSYFESTIIELKEVRSYSPRYFFIFYDSAIQIWTSHLRLRCDMQIIIIIIIIIIILINESNLLRELKYIFLSIKFCDNDYQRWLI